MTAPRPLRALAVAVLLTAAPSVFATETAPIDPATRAAIEATCFDYVDGQLEGDPARVARALHPDLAKRRVLGETADEKLGLRRMSKEELVELTRQGALKTPKERWDRSCAALDVAGNVAVARAETPWFVDFFHLGKFGERWVIVNALWYAKPKPVKP
ncbi:nuclear transport factor 2 family protein [Lysobacter sp. K5869]|uniref:nuclear transport factor 2 family protein n=1 Tax=Lysobacter sp. K5869 TaxID=2820808 RepID=UPI001C062673|nr:nuclear transport factor 2 family protein [Lysobacter sp. K5869]QWP77757.1 nuclear transport factor 2 family protein [Lysobacter sp. K5869]